MRKFQHERIQIPYKLQSSYNTYSHVQGENRDYKNIVPPEPSELSELEGIGSAFTTGEFDTLVFEPLSTTLVNPVSDATIPWNSSLTINAAKTSINDSLSSSYVESLRPFLLVTFSS